jgi:hypothetical protein
VSHGPAPGGPLRRRVVSLVSCEKDKEGALWPTHPTSVRSGICRTRSARPPPASSPFMGSPASSRSLFTQSENCSRSTPLDPRRHRSRLSVRAVRRQPAYAHAFGRCMRVQPPQALRDDLVPCVGWAGAPDRASDSPRLPHRHRPRNAGQSAARRRHRGERACLLNRAESVSQPPGCPVLRTMVSGPCGEGPPFCAKAQCP